MRFGLCAGIFRKLFKIHLIGDTFCFVPPLCRRCFLKAVADDGTKKNGPTQCAARILF